MLMQEFVALAGIIGALAVGVVELIASAQKS